MSLHNVEEGGPRDRLCLVICHTFSALRLQACQRDYLVALCDTMTQIEAAVLSARQQSYSLHDGLREETKTGRKKCQNMYLGFYGVQSWRIRQS